MDEIVAIQLLREVLRGETAAPLPPNSVQRRRTAQTAAAKEKFTVKEAQPSPATITPDLDQEWISSAPVGTEPKAKANDQDDKPNYILDDDSVQPNNGGGCRSKRILRQQRIDNQRALHHIVNLVSTETADVPDF